MSAFYNSLVIVLTIAVCCGIINVYKKKLFGVDMKRRLLLFVAIILIMSTVGGLCGCYADITPPPPEPDNPILSDPDAQETISVSAK